jgi:hypothetical protein
MFISSRHPDALVSFTRSSSFLRALTAIGLVAVPVIAGCSPQPSPAADGPLGQAEQHLTQCVTFQRGGTGDVADTMIDAHSPTANYGTGASFDAAKYEEGLLRVDLSSIPGYAIVNSATLNLYIFGGSTDTKPVNLHQVLAPWAESAVTYTSFNQKFSPTIIGSLTPPTKNGAYKAVDLTSLTASWVAGNTPNYGVLLETVPQSAAGGADFASGEEGAPYEPSLVVCYQTPDNHCGPPNPCANGGSCVNGWSGYTCACAPGFAGDTCQNNMNECAQGPCLNGGTCTNGSNSYTCACPAGYSGQSCQTIVDNCAPSPCQNGGICTNGIDSYTCSCPADFTGANCQTPNACGDHPCVHGACADAGSSYTCACQAGYTGQNCDVLVDNCPGNACANGSMCVNGLNGYTCACLPGYGGAHCEDDLQDCEQQQPCLHGGTCTDGVNSYTCTCAPGYTDSNCQTDINDCASQPCQNGGMCVDGVNSYTCQCPAGFSGTNCESRGACESGDPCNVGAFDPYTGQQLGLACTDTAGGGYTCQCGAYAAGASCDVVCPCSDSALLAGDGATYDAWQYAIYGYGDRCTMQGSETTVDLFNDNYAYSISLSPTSCAGSFGNGEQQPYPLTADQHAACQAIVDFAQSNGGFSCAPCAGPSTATTPLYLTDFSRAACGPNVSGFPTQGSVTVTDAACGGSALTVHFSTVGGVPNATYIAAVTCVTFLGDYTTDENGNGGGDFAFSASPGQAVGFDTQVTFDGTGNDLDYYTSAQSNVITLP